MAIQSLKIFSLALDCHACGLAMTRGVTPNLVDKSKLFYYAVPAFVDKSPYPLSLPKGDYYAKVGLLCYYANRSR